MHLVLAVAIIVGAAPWYVDPVKTLPDAYSLQFENAWVTIVKVRYAPHAKLPEHDHPQFATAYVYLNDAPPVVFRHRGRGSVVTRPSTTTGSFRLFRAVPNEVHAVENTGDVASEFLRVEFKTTPKDERALRGRFARESVPAGDNLQRVEFENDMIRISRVVCVPGKTLDVAATSSGPALLVDIPSGRERWIAAGERETVDNRIAQPIEMLRFDFKTAPIE